VQKLLNNGDRFTSKVPVPSDHKYLNDSSLKEVAEFAGISVAATKSRLSRAKKTLCKAFERKEPITS
jgi:DNA-directed RNA polymerase specialized sigma24 family protein